MTPSCRRLLDDLRLRNYSIWTEKVYVWHVAALGRHFKTDPHLLGVREIREYLMFIINERNYSWSWWRQAVGALRFFYGTTLGRRHVVPQIPYPRREIKLPVVLSTSEVERLLRAAIHPKQRAILMTIYAAGLRLTEALLLTPRDIDPSRMTIHVRRAKGKRDRFVPLSPVLLEVLRQFRRQAPDGPWLFPGKRADTFMSARAVEWATSKAAERAGLVKRVTPRTLRHSFATHLLEAGADLLVIQALLGHACLTSTIVYTHLSQTRLGLVKSPLDSLDLSFTGTQLSLQGI